MKLKSIFITGALALSCGSLQALEAVKSNAELYLKQQSTTELIGTEVWNLQNEKLGRVKFITADLENARLVEVVISSGGFMGMGGKITSAPPRAFTLDPNKQILRLNVTKARFDAAPSFKTSDVASYSQRDRVAAVLRYFGLQPWFYLDGQAATKNAEILNLGKVQKTQDILGLQIKSKTGQYLGQVGSLLIDLPKGQIVHVVDDTQAMGNDGSYILQARALRYNASHNGLVLDESFASLKDEPHFKWIGGTRQSYQEEAYVNNKVRNDSGLHSTQNAQEGIVANATAMTQGANSRDVKKTYQVNQDIQRDSRLSANARNVEVVTLNAQTTLRGHVNTAEDKSKIGEFAAKAGRPENVSNLLEVRTLR
ncbi:MAG: hypothetical protein JWR15_428 [Prosthecobacter sp.]|nr:hypothetical protein [Prosthecobacter sp.]